ncbi:MAG: hypothetical protein IH591_10420 [Bacteroidales bacterium]|nr:hypothetical protein [Bacteroidales bacterium]
MKTRIIKSAIAVAALLIMACITPQTASAQKKLQLSMGGYHGELDFPISWKRYYSYTEWTKIMHDMQKQYPQLADIESIGKSRMGRDQFLLTITSKATGSHDTKTAMWVDGAIHGNEVNGITCSLYLAWYLLTRYDYDPYVYNLVNKYTFYVLPGLNVDANDGYVSFPNNENNPREPYRPEDNDGDGLYDEDLTEDVDGDGELTTMYKEDPKGDYRLSADKKRFVRVEDDSFVGLRFTRLGAEGFDNDGDGQMGEDDLGGPDPNRNFPYGWNQRDGEYYPLSEPETRNVFESQLKRPNIFASFHYHNTGRLIMFQAPPATRTTPEAQAQNNETVAARLAEMRQTNKYAQLFTRQVSGEYRHDMDVQTKIVTDGSFIMKTYEPTIGGLSGQAHAATYYMMGAYSYLIELWGSPTPFADMNDDGRVSEEESQAWLDLDLMGAGWIEPYQFDHPDFGKIWMGGSMRKHIGRTPPGRYIEQEAEKNAMFVLYCANQFPVVTIDNVEVEPVTGDLWWVTVTVANDKVYPTASDMSLQLNRAIQDKLTAKTSANIKIMPVGTSSGGSGRGTGQAAQAMQAMAGQRGAMTGSQPRVTSSTELMFRLQGQQKLSYRYLVSMSGNSGWMEFDIWSKNGGTDNKKVEIKIK